MIEQASDEQEKGFEVWPENWDAVVLFVRLATQWTIIAAGMGKPIVTGMNYAAVGATMNILRVKDKQAAFDDLQVMELAALQVLNSENVGPGAS